MSAATHKPVPLRVALASLGLETSGLLEGWEDRVRAERALKSELGIVAHVGVITIEGSTSVSVDVHRVATTMIYTHVLNRGPLCVRSPLDKKNS